MVSLSTLFHIVNGNGFALSDMELDDKGINFIARGENYNGVAARVKEIPAVTPFEPHQITVALSGSVLESFYQNEPFYTSFHIKILKPRQPLTINMMLFYCMAIKSNKYRYSFGRQANRTLDEMLVPAISEIPKWVKNLPFPKQPKATPFHHKLVKFDDRKWKYFSMEQVFPQLEKCKCSNATALLVKGDDIDYIGAKKTDNGVMERVKRVERLVTKGNCMVFIGDGAGSVGYATYQPNDFIGSSTLSAGYNDRLNVYSALFLITILDLERYRYSFGRKYGKEQVRSSKIKLPTTSDGKIDWGFMEYYIKSLPFSSNLKTNQGLSDEELVEKYEAGQMELGFAVKKMLKKPN